MKLRRRMLISVLVAAIRGYIVYLYSKQLLPQVPIIGFMIGFLAGFVVDRGARESSIFDNILVAALVSGLTTLYDVHGGITEAILRIQLGKRAIISLGFLAGFAIISMVFNELLTGKPTKVGSIALAAALVSLIAFGLAVQYKAVVVQDYSYEFTTPDRANVYARRINSTYSVLQPYVLTISVTNSTTTLTLLPAAENGYVPYVYIPLETNFTERKAGVYEFSVSITLMVNSVVKRPEQVDDSDLIIRFALRNSGGIYIRFSDSYELSLENGTVTLNTTFDARLAAIINDVNVALYIMISDIMDGGTGVSSVSFIISRKLIKEQNVSKEAIYVAIAATFIAALDAVPEFSFSSGRRRRR